MAGSCYELFFTVNWLDWAKTIFDLIKGIAWPFSFLIVVAIFSKELRERIKDIVSVGPTGAVLQNSSQHAQKKPSTGLAKPTTHPLPTVQALILKIESQLAEMPEDEHESKLITALAEAQIETGFEYVWGAIFGSQITALRKLREAGSISIVEAELHYEKDVRKQHEVLVDWTFSQWSEYLFNQQLITLVDKDRLSLTDYGRDFLAFVDLRKADQSKGV